MIRFITLMIALFLFIGCVLVLYHTFDVLKLRVSHGWLIAPLALVITIVLMWFDSKQNNK